MMIKPAFRQSQAIIHLLRAIDSFITAGSMPVDLYYGDAVTTHTGSQKVGVRTSFRPLALYLAVCVAVDFRGMKMAATERETFVVWVRFTTPPTPELLYMPARHHAVMAGLLAQAGYNCRLSGDEKIPARESTELTVEDDDGECSAYILVNELGKDWQECLQKKIFAERVKGMRTIIVFIPAWCSVPPDLDREMGRFNAVFSGVKPTSAAECHLVYSVLSNSVDFERILLLDPLARRLKEHSCQLYGEIIAE
jgi:hypothetical protein